MKPATLGAGTDAWGIWHASHPDQIPWQRYLDEVREAGYRYVEPGPYGYMPTDAAHLRRELASRGLSLPGGTFFARIASAEQFPEAMRALDATAAWLAELGARYFVCLDDFYRDNYSGKPTAARRLDPAAWSRMIDNTHAMSRRVRERHGLSLVFHPHCDAQIEEEPEIERFLADTDPALVGLCLDTGHHAYCGGDPVAFFRRHAARIPYLHLKSMNDRTLAGVRVGDIPWGEAVRRGVTEEPERGIVDFRALYAAIEAVGYDGYAIVEQDMFPADPEACLPIARRAIAYLTGIGFRL